MIIYQELIKKDIEIFIVKIHDIGVIGVYKAPGKNLSDVLKEFIKLNYEKLIDVLCLAGVYLKNLRSYSDLNKHACISVKESLRVF